MGPGSALALLACPGRRKLFSRHDLPELCQKRHALLQFRGRRECRMRAAPAVSCATCTKNMHMSIQGSGEHPTFPAQGKDRPTKTSIYQYDEAFVSSVVSQRD